LASREPRPVTDEELRRLADERLLERIRACAKAGQAPEARRTLEELVLRYADDVRRRVSMKVPRDHVDDVAQMALISAIAAAFGGTSIGEFRAWLNTIVARRIADFTRARVAQPDIVPLVEEHGDDDDTWGSALEGLEPDAAEVDVRVVIAETIEEFNEAHRAVIVLYAYMNRSAAQTAEEINARLGDRLDPPMTEANVQQIGSRFRRRLRENLDARNTSE